MKRTKIVCTIGPTSEDAETLKKIMEAGMDAARLNFSHGSHEEQKEKIDLVKELRKELDLPIAIILDTKGPEIRTGDFKDGRIVLKEGQEFVITTDDVLGDEHRMSTSYKNIVDDVNVGDSILVDDGLIELIVKNIKGSEIITQVNNGGEVKNKKGINIPGVHVNLPSITDNDRRDIMFGVSENIDFVAASFVRTGEDVRELRRLLDLNAGEGVKIISKIENKEGVVNIDDIINESDGIMIARGDLGVEIPPEEVPLIQKTIIKKCNRKGKFVITATQMLDSMMRNPRPTRAEVADVANAILDGTDAVMLSGETASGKYPLESVQMMVDIALASEEGIDYDGKIRKYRKTLENTVTNAIGFATCSSAESLDATAIIAPTTSGYTATVMSQFRPKAPIISFSASRRVMRRLALVWGVIPYYCEYMDEENTFFNKVIEQTKVEGLIRDDDIIILTAGLPLGIGGKTNMMRIHKVGSED